MGTNASPLLRAAALEKTYPALAAGAPAVQLFRGLSLEVAAGEMVAIVGASGTGKSSLLHLLAALDTPTSGSVRCGETDVTALRGDERAAWRNHAVGYVWQFHYLLPEFTALENIALPLLARGTRRSEALRAASAWLARVGLADRAEHRSGELSGGEQQRVSLARALVTKPKLLLADEPTGDLDNATAEAVFALLQQVQREENLAAVLVTHNPVFAQRCDRVLRLASGQLLPDAPHPGLSS
jgi:lipoprotein-releasing system ATP-binding protein